MEWICHLIQELAVLFLRTVSFLEPVLSFFLPGTGRNSTGNISGKYSTYNSKLTLGAVACCLCQKSVI